MSTTQDQASCANPYCDRAGTVRVTFFGRYIAHTCDGCIRTMVVGTEWRRGSPEDVLRLIIPIPVNDAETAAEREDLIAYVRRNVAEGVEYELRRRWGQEAPDGER